MPGLELGGQSTASHVLGDEAECRPPRRWIRRPVYARAIDTLTARIRVDHCRHADCIGPRGERARTMTFDFLIESYATERVKVLSVWSGFRDDDLAMRPRPDDARGRSVIEHMVHQCVSEDTWF